jgi:hypothetical protein
VASTFTVKSRSAFVLNVPRDVLRHLGVFGDLPRAVDGRCGVGGEDDDRPCEDVPPSNQLSHARS